MKKIASILFLAINICLGQKSLDKRYRVNVSQTDSIQILTKYSDQSKREAIEEKYSNWHERSRALEKYLLSNENPGITRDINDIIEVKLLNGKKIKLIPNPKYDETDFVFENYFKHLKMLLFRVQWGEGNNFAIIDITNGTKTYIIGQPYFSPDKKFMVVANCDIQAQYSNNGFELFEIVNRNFKEIWRHDPTTWGPIELKWLITQL